MQPQQGGVSKNVILSYIIRIIPFPNNHFNRDTDNQPVLITWGWSPLFKQPQVGDPQSDCQELRSRVLSSIVYFNGVTAGATRHRCILCFLFLYICIYNFIIFICICICIWIMRTCVTKYHIIQSYVSNFTHVRKNIVWKLNTVPGLWTQNTQLRCFFLSSQSSAEVADVGVGKFVAAASTAALSRNSWWSLSTNRCPMRYWMFSCADALKYQSLFVCESQWS
jgi:hypothetical protein